MSLKTVLPDFIKFPLGKMRYAAKTSWHVDILRNPGTATLIAGSERSGTTWLTQIINHNHDFRIVWEPFRPEEPLCREFASRQYIRPHAKDDRFLKPVTQILSRRIRGARVDHANPRILSWKRIVKDTRSNLMLKWFRVNFPALPIIFIVRHPCAVAVSSLARGWTSTIWYLRHLCEQKELAEDYIGKIADHILSTSDLLEQLVFLWCIEHMVAFDQLSPQDVCLVFYEELFHNPEQQLHRVFSSLNRPLPPSVFDTISTPSLTSSESLQSGGDPTTSWQKKITPEQMKRILELLDYFGLGQLYNEDARPHLNTQGWPCIQKPKFTR